MLKKKFGRPVTAGGWEGGERRGRVDGGKNNAFPTRLRRARARPDDGGGAV